MRNALILALSIGTLVGSVAWADPKPLPRLRDAEFEGSVYRTWKDENGYHREKIEECSLKGGAGVFDSGSLPYTEWYITGENVYTCSLEIDGKKHSMTVYAYIHYSDQERGRNKGFGAGFFLYPNPQTTPPTYPVVGSSHVSTQDENLKTLAFQSHVVRNEFATRADNLEFTFFARFNDSAL